ncbi:hypothetical protein OIU83_03510 [Flavobacterium sp. LS1R49]|uniref:Uncharacterized protein n=1 Tax=Flavobacterium shii TaxID=2987687 RepID=A0A9X3C6I9_9FLAO|nr:hypothetical protein [Flavobacterium shii]MCV9926698.1 hypothetical protein [Flavobacterium shii]
MKKNLAIAFGAVYMLFFAIPFPMLIYYSVNDEYDIIPLKEKDPWLALILVSVSIILWLILFIGYFRKWILQVFITKKILERAKIKGVLREAKIISAEKISKSGAKLNTYELELLFKNLSDTEISHKTTITDAKPHERRFEIGKKINLTLNRDPKQPPYFIISTTTARINIVSLVLKIIGWLILLAAIIGYYLYSYQTESNGMGWRFMSFGHPLIVCPTILLFYRFLARFIYNKLTGINDNSILIKFKGIKTSAKLIRASQTGVYINEQPMIRFELEYTDHHHHTHKSSLKKIVGLLELDLTKQEQIDIFYLPEDPKQIVFASDLNNMI